MTFLKKMSDKKLLALHRVAKTRGYAFFRNPQDMIVLRDEKERRGL